MGDYAVPESIRKHKPKGTMVKKIKNGFYVYTFKSYKDESGKRKTKTIACIGKITEESGFVPNHSHLLKAGKTCYEYGQYAVAFSASQNVLEKLKKVFTVQDAHTIYLLALLRVVNKHTGVAKMGKEYELSHLSMKYPSVSLSGEVVTNLLDDLGRKQTKVMEFEQSLIDEAGEIALDVLEMKTGSQKDEGREYGSTCREGKSPRTRLFMGYDMERKIPVFSRMCLGDEDGSFQEMLDRYHHKDVIFLMDRGFSDEKSFEILQKHDCGSIIPLSENLEDYKQIVKDQNFTGRFLFSSGKGKKKESQIVYYKEGESDGKRIFLFKNMTDNNREQLDYLSNREKYPALFPEEEFEKNKDWLGTIALRTNLPREKADGEYVYCAYERRRSMESPCSSLKNDVSFSGREAVDDYCKIQGLCFIALVSGLIHAELRDKIQPLKGLSVDDVLDECKTLKLGFQNGHWKFFNESKELYTLMKKMGFDCYRDLDELNGNLSSRRGEP